MSSMMDRPERQALNVDAAVRDRYSAAAEAAEAAALVSEIAAAAALCSASTTKLATSFRVAVLDASPEPPEPRYIDKVNLLFNLCEVH